MAWTQLPQEAQGVAVAIFVYTFLCLLCNVLMLWLLWTSRQMLSHVGLICIFTFICVCVNLIQQIYDNLYWVDVQTARFNHIKANVGNPLLAASNGVTGLELVLWAIRYGSATVAAGQACIWALFLAQAVYGWAKFRWANVILVHHCGKLIAIILPIIFLGVIHLDAVQRVPVLFYFLLDVLFFGAVAGGAFGLFIILVKYIATRRELKSWEVATQVDGHTTWRSFRLSDDTPADQIPAQHSLGIYDSWLLVRFSVAFFFMVAFEMHTVAIQITGQKAMHATAAATTPDLSASLAMEHLALFIPSAFASALGLFTFGTTSHFRNTMYKTFVPQRWQRTTHRMLPAPPPKASRDLDDAIIGDYVMGRGITDRASWLAGVRNSGNGAIPSQAQEGSVGLRLPERAAVRSLGAGGGILRSSIYAELGHVS